MKVLRTLFFLLIVAVLGGILLYSPGKLLSYLVGGELYFSPTLLAVMAGILLGAIFVFVHAYHKEKREGTLPSYLDLEWKWPWEEWP